jgi:SAM-dependent methyltransferase
MRLAFADRDPADVRVADVGCLEGGYSVELARAGYVTLGIEGREENFACCEYVRERVGLSNLQFACDDVRNLEAYGTFDAVVCAGLLYHLDAPTAFLELLGRITRRLVIVVSTYATDTEGVGFDLGGWTTHEGRRGRWYGEVGEHQDADTHLASRWASLGNRASFWLAKRELVQAIRDAGFDLAFEQFDFVDDNVTDDYVERNSCSMFVGVATADLVP